MKRLSYMAIGLIAGIVIGLTSTAYAEDVTAAFTKFTFKVNGEEKLLEADPLVYQGSTYLPVRVVANMLGYDVTYKADARSIELSQPSSSPTETATAPNEATGGTAVNQMTLQDFDKQIGVINKNIDALKEFKKALTDEAKIQEVNKRVADYESQIAELEKQKAALVSQPTPTP